MQFSTTWAWYYLENKHLKEVWQALQFNVCVCESEIAHNIQVKT